MRDRQGSMTYWRRGHLCGFFMWLISNNFFPKIGNYQISLRFVLVQSPQETADTWSVPVNRIYRFIQSQFQLESVSSIYKLRPHRRLDIQLRFVLTPKAPCEMIHVLLTYFSYSTQEMLVDFNGLVQANKKKLSLNWCLIFTYSIFKFWSEISMTKHSKLKSDICN